MIRVTCPSCAFTRDVDPAAVPRGVTNVTCPVCREIFPYGAGPRRKAGFFVRSLALLIDVLVLNIVFLVFSYGLDELLTVGLASAGVVDDDFVNKLVGSIIYFGCAILMFSYFVFATSRFGMTIGKRVLGIRVVDADGAVPGLRRAIKRELWGKLLSSVLFGAGFLWVFFDSNRQSLHDRIAGTFVIVL